MGRGDWIDDWESKLENKKWLYDKYHNEKLSLKEIGDIIGCSDSTVRTRMSKYSIKRKGIDSTFDEYDPRLSNRNWLVWMYCHKNGTIEDIVEETGSTYGVVKGCIKRNYIKRYHNNKSVRPSEDYPFDWIDIKIEVHARDNHTCQECNDKNKKLHCHHIVPISRGGSHNPKNLITLCKSCHRNKHDHMEKE